MKRVMWIITFMLLIGTAIAIQFFPDSVPMHMDMAGNIDRWGSKYEELIYPVIVVVISLFWTLLIKYYEKKALKTENEKDLAGIKTNVKVIGIAAVAETVLFAAMQCFFLYTSYTAAIAKDSRISVDLMRVTSILCAALLIVLGNVMTKTRTNNVIGVRVVWSMYNDNTWKKTNLFGAIAFIITGIITIIMSAILPTGDLALVVLLVLIIIATIATLVYSAKVYKEEIAAEKKES
ncbi:MAG: DUF1648 domain-containing protein [Lachnospiraceae bacterium]|nr:DUF1648 domain-containing protein [Lachnospiraceae bacterium]